MKTTLTFVITLLLQTLSAVSADLEKIQPGVTTAMVPVGDSMAQDLLEKYVVFRWEANNTFAQETFEFQLNEPTVLQIVDFKHHGDMFDVYDNGKQIGSTSNVVYDEDVEIYAATPQDALTDDHFSKGSFNLDKGQHNVTILAHGPYDAGSAAIRLIQRTNLVLAKDEQGQTSTEQETKKEEPNVDQEEEEMEEEEYDEEDQENDFDEEKEVVPEKKTDRDNWKKMFLKKKSGSKDKHMEYKHIPDKKKQYLGQRYNHYKHERPAYHKESHHEGPKTITHWKVVRKTAVPYATRVAYEKEKY